MASAGIKVSNRQGGNRAKGHGGSESATEAEERTVDSSGADRQHNSKNTQQTSEAASSDGQRKDAATSLSSRQEENGSTECTIVEA